MGAGCSSYDGDDEGKTKYDMSRGCMKALNITPLSLYHALLEKNDDGGLDKEMHLLRKVLAMLNEESLLETAKFCCLADYVGLGWYRGNASMHVFVGSDDAQTRFHHVAGDFVFGVTCLSIKESPEFVDEFRKELLSTKQCFEKTE